MVDVTEDQNTAEQVFESFREIADGKPYVTEMDLTHSLIPDEIVQNLVASMPRHGGAEVGLEREAGRFDYVEFMEKFVSGRRANGGH
ncbi:alpha-actinin [Teratosphaeriaceae sp. CCFEE 6253]|nr:alpha-actinin [Teratosphaeriaceae sp. CCFEE 6253]